jgi:hypothetical protein
MVMMEMVVVVVVQVVPDLRAPVAPVDAEVVRLLVAGAALVALVVPVDKEDMAGVAPLQFMYGAEAELSLIVP